MGAWDLIGHHDAGAWIEPGWAHASRNQGCDAHSKTMSRMEIRRGSKRAIERGERATVVGEVDQVVVATSRRTLLSPAELAAYLGIPLATIYRWRSRGDGPCGIRVGRHVRYRVEDVERWLDERREQRA